jgi:Na+-driven multidrug efflux pump
MTLCMNFVLIQRIGNLGVNAFSVISYIASFSITAFFGASEGLQPLFGQSYGAKNEADLKYYLKTGLTISAVGSVLITGLSILLGKPICVLFGTDAVTTEYIIKYLSQFAVGSIITAVNVMISAYLYSTERSALSTGINILRSLVINSAVILILPRILGDGAIWSSLLIYEAIVLVIAVGSLKYSERNGIQFK